MDSDNVEKKMELVDEYCDIVQILLDFLYKKGNGSLEVTKIKTKVEYGLRNNRAYIIQKTGPYLYKFKDQIIQRSVEFFENMDYDKSYKKEIKNYDSSVVKYIRMLWKSLNNREIDKVIDNVQSALGIYIKYVLLEKKIG